MLRPISIYQGHARGGRSENPGRSEHRTASAHSSADGSAHRPRYTHARRIRCRPHSRRAQSRRAPATEQVCGGRERLAAGQQERRALLLYCNGPFCQASRRRGRATRDRGLHQCAPLSTRHSGLARARRSEQRSRSAASRACSVSIAPPFIHRCAARPATLPKAAFPGAQRAPPPRTSASGKLGKVPLPEDDFNRRVILLGATPRKRGRLRRGLPRQAAMAQCFLLCRIV